MLCFPPCKQKSHQGLNIYVMYISSPSDVNSLETLSLAHLQTADCGSAVNMLPYSSHLSHTRMQPSQNANPKGISHYNLSVTKCVGSQIHEHWDGMSIVLHHWAFLSPHLYSGVENNLDHSSWSVSSSLKPYILSKFSSTTSPPPWLTLNGVRGGGWLAAWMSSRAVEDFVPILCLGQLPLRCSLTPLVLIIPLVSPADAHYPSMSWDTQEQTFWAIFVTSTSHFNSLCICSFFRCLPGGSGHPGRSPRTTWSAEMLWCAPSPFFQTPLLPRLSTAEDLGRMCQPPLSSSYQTYLGYASTMRHLPPPALGWYGWGSFTVGLRTLTLSPCLLPHFSGNHCNQKGSWSPLRVMWNLTFTPSCIFHLVVAVEFIYALILGFSPKAQHLWSKSFHFQD